MEYLKVILSNSEFKSQRNNYYDNVMIIFGDYC